MNVTPEQQEKLEAVFEQAPKPSHAAHQLLATKMGVSPQQTKVWFCDARQRKRVLGQGGSGGGSLGTLQQSENSLLQIEVPLRALKLVTNSPGYRIFTREPHDVPLAFASLSLRTPAARVLSLRCAPSRRSSQHDSEAKKAPSSRS